MACFPKIDSPCPLDPGAQRRIAGDCNRCGKTVHTLDMLDPAQRMSLLRNASGPLCVSYRLPMALGAVLALSMGAQAAVAADTPTPFAPVDAAQLQEDNDLSELGNLDMIMVGGVSDPTHAEWIDDNALPDLPIVVEEAAPRG